MINKNRIYAYASALRLLKAVLNGRRAVKQGGVLVTRTRFMNTLNRAYR